MRLTSIVFILFFPVLSFCQADINKSCKPNIDIKINICGSRFIKDSLCPACYECRTRLVASDSSFSIVSFKVTAGGEGFDDYIDEAPNAGADINSPHVRNIINKLRKGSYIEFTCIIAKHRNGHFYTLQPLFLEL